MNNKLSVFEESILNYNNIEFEYPYQVKLFVKKLNEFIIGYYRDSIYLFLLKNKIENSINHSISDAELINYINEINNKKGYMLFPQKLLDVVDKSYICFLMNKAISFAYKVDYTGYTYDKFLKMSKKKKIGNFVRYSDCVESVKAMDELEKYKLSDFVIDNEHRINSPKFNKKVQLIDFCDRLYNYYNGIDDKSQENELKIKKNKLELIKKNITE